MTALKLGDRILIAIGVVACIAAGAWFFLGGGGAATSADGGGSADADAGLLVVCQTTDGFRRVDPLSGSVIYTVTSTEGPEEGSNTVRIANGTVDVTKADCSNQICVEHDPISQPGEQIVCLPHGMVVEVVAHEEDAAELV